MSLLTQHGEKSRAALRFVDATPLSCAPAQQAGAFQETRGQANSVQTPCLQGNGHKVAHKRASVGRGVVARVWTSGSWLRVRGLRVVRVLLGRFGKILLSLAVLASKPLLSETSVRSPIRCALMSRALLGTSMKSPSFFWSSAWMAYNFICIFDIRARMARRSLAFMCWR